MNGYVFFAAVLLVVATLFAVVSEPFQFGSAGVAPNVMAGLASLGFAIAGGCSLIAAAIAGAKRNTSD